MSPRARRRLGADGRILEPAWQDQVVGWARYYGWSRIYHAPHGGTGGGRSGKAHQVALGQLPEGRGFPDLVLLKDVHLVVAELKRDPERETVAARTAQMGPGQPAWLDAWTLFGAAVNEGASADVDEFGSTAAVEERRSAGAAREWPSVTVRVWRPADEADVLDVLGRWSKLPRPM